jgi:hypothetical protein
VENSGGDNSNGDDGSFSDNAQGGTNGGNE